MSRCQMGVVWQEAYPFSENVLLHLVKNIEVDFLILAARRTLRKHWYKDEGVGDCSRWVTVSCWSWYCPGWRRVGIAFSESSADRFGAFRIGSWNARSRSCRVYSDAWARADSDILQRTTLAERYGKAELTLEFQGKQRGRGLKK